MGSIAKLLETRSVTGIEAAGLSEVPPRKGLPFTALLEDLSVNSGAFCLAAAKL